MTRIPVRIAGTSSLQPGAAVSTAELVERLPEARNAADVEARSGITSRHFADPDTTAASMGATVMQRALDDAGLEASALDRLIFVDSLGGDLLFPATANLVVAELGLAGTCDCFDLGNACMGFLTAFDIAARGIATGQGPVGIVVSELGSRYITPNDPRPYLVFADAAVAAVLVPTDGEDGVLGVSLRNDGIAFGNVRLDHPGVTGKHETMRFTASSARIAEEATDAITSSTSAALDAAGLSLDDVRWILPHQPNGKLLVTLRDALGVDDERIVPVVGTLGSVGAASIPFSLDRLWQSGRVAPGDRVLMVGVGAGMSYGAIVYQVAA